MVELTGTHNSNPEPKEIVRPSIEPFDGLRDAKLGAIERLLGHVHLLAGTEKALVVTLGALCAMLYMPSGREEVKLAAMGAALLAGLVCMAFTTVRDGKTEKR